LTLAEAKYVLADWDNEVERLLLSPSALAMKSLRSRLSDALQVLVLQNEIEISTEVGR
jgi:hypothetical protein